ncbi:MAG: PqqD family protein [Chlorobi bacterium]|nr:PqqD family protein [Chlorobiota bacterium]
MKIKKNVAVSDSGFVFNPTTGESFSVNPIGMKIVEMLKKETPTQEISNYILENYETDAPTIDKDLYDFIEMLKQYSLIEENEKA